MKIILKTKEFPLSAELIPKAKAITNYVYETNAKMSECKLDEIGINSNSFRALKENFYRDAKADIPNLDKNLYYDASWSISDDGNNLIAYWYEFEE